MLLNAFPNHATPSPTGTATDAGAEAVRPALAPVAPAGGRALLAVLEQMAQAELAVMVGLAGMDEPHPDPALAGLAWDLGLTGADIAASGSAMVD